MIADILQAIGGIGVFLLGMVIMTDGLKSLAGARINRFLVNATHTPWSGALTGAAGTAILQSSSATTVAAVGFVGAGMLTFTQALGIIFGANVGTTVTGWMVALLGFKLKLGSLLLPMIFVGVLMRLFARPVLAQTGYAIAGFALIFVGIDLLQQAASGATDLIRPELFPASDGLMGRLQLVLLGMLVTVITQSSSAGVAAALVAINAGAISFEQGAALVIGMDVGTTVTAAMATVGGSVNTRRTGLSHVTYNAFTAIGALILITPFTWVWQHFAPGMIENNAEIVLVAFHTSFNLLGVILVLPFSTPFARLMERIVPAGEPHYRHNLDPALLSQPSVALITVEKIIVTEFKTLMININLILEQQSDVFRADMANLQTVLDDTHAFLDRIHIDNQASREARKLIGLIHALDHMQRLHERCDEELDRALSASRHEALAEVETILDAQIDRIIAAVDVEDWPLAWQIAQETHDAIREMEQPQRENIYAAVARGELDVPTGTECAEALRWLNRVSRHLSRICYHFQSIPPR